MSPKKTKCRFFLLLNSLAESHLLTSKELTLQRITTDNYSCTMITWTIMTATTIMSANRFGPIMSGPLCPRVHYVRPIMSAGPMCPAHYVSRPITRSPLCPRAPLSGTSQGACGKAPKKTMHAIASGEVKRTFTSPFRGRYL